MFISRKYHSIYEHTSKKGTLIFRIVNQIGRPITKCLKSAQKHWSNLSQGTKKGTCSLCYLPNHRINTPCSIIQDLKMQLIVKTDIEGFAHELSKPKYCTFGILNDKTKESLKNVNWTQQKVWPPEAQQLVVVIIYPDPMENNLPQAFFTIRSKKLSINYNIV